MRQLVLQDFATALGDVLAGSCGNLQTPVKLATDDSRQVQQGSLFCAINGAQTDGAKFLPQAVAKGACAVIVRQGVDVPDGIPALFVNNDYRAAGIVAELAAGMPTQQFKVLAVTGTNGKTTSAFLLRDILNHAGFKTAMIGTVEYDLADGTPLPADRTTPTAFNLQKLFAKIACNKADFCVIELSSHALDQQRIGNLKTAGAIFTNLTQDHLDYHLTLENYFQAKKRLFTNHLMTHAPAVINADAPFGKRLIDELAHPPALCDVISFSVKNFCPPVVVHVKDLKLSPKGTECALSYPDGDWSIASPLAGLYNGYNIAGVAILAHALGLPNPTVKQALATSIGAPGRLQAVSRKNNVNVFVDYAHTPDALLNVMETLRNITDGRLIAVFGCGGDRDRTKRPIMGNIAAQNADLAIVTSDNPRTEKPDDIIADIVKGIPQDLQSRCIVEPDRRKAIQAAIQAAQPGDSILVAGKGHEDYQEINGVKYHFQDAECILDFLA